MPDQPLTIFLDTPVANELLVMLAHWESENEAKRTHHETASHNCQMTLHAPSLRLTQAPNLNDTLV